MRPNSKVSNGHSLNSHHIKMLFTHLANSVWRERAQFISTTSTWAGVSPGYVGYWASRGEHGVILLRLDWISSRTGNDPKGTHAGTGCSNKLQITRFLGTAWVLRYGSLQWWSRAARRWSLLACSVVVCGRNMAQILLTIVDQYRACRHENGRPRYDLLVHFMRWLWLALITSADLNHVVGF